MFFFISPVHSLNNGCAVAAAARATTIYYFTCYITTTASNAYSCPCNVMMKSTGADTMIIVRATPLSCVPSISVSLCSMLHERRCFFGSSSCIFHHISISFFVSFPLRIFRPFLHIVCSCVRCVREYLYKWAKVAKMWREKANSCHKRMFGMEEKMILSWLKQ